MANLILRGDSNPSPGKYLLKYVVPADVASINLTTDKYGNTFNFVEGEEIEIIMQIKDWVNSDISRINIRINSISSNSYNWSNIINSSYIGTVGSSYFAQYSITRISNIGNEIQGYSIAHVKTADTPVFNQQFVNFSTSGLNIINITSIYLFTTTTNIYIPAGAVILIKKR